MREPYIVHSNHVGEQKCDLKKTEWKKQGYLRLRNCPTKAAEPIKRGAQRVAMNLVLRINREGENIYSLRRLDCVVEGCSSELAVFSSLFSVVLIVFLLALRFPCSDSI